jgi:hypothetical protein
MFEDQPHGGDAPAGQTRRDDRPTRVLAIGMNADTLSELERSTVDIRVAPDLDTAWDWLAPDEFDALMIGPDVGKPEALGIARKLSESDLAAHPVFAHTRPTVAFSVEAMRSGAIDLIKVPLQTDHAMGALDRARERADFARSQKRRVERLKKICQRLHASREDANRQVDTLCTDLAQAYQEIARHMPTDAMANPYAQSIRQELDVESLLRMTLEHLLTKTGPTNAAVYLPTGSGDYALGAYVNYSLDSDSADVTLDHLADTLAPRFADEEGLRVFPGTADLECWSEGIGAWIGDVCSVVFACRNEGETLAVATLFRDAGEPFCEEALEEIQLVKDVFAQQLARVIRIHNRHKPKDTWPGFEVDERTDDYDFDSGADDYGMAA